MGAERTQATRNKERIEQMAKAEEELRKENLENEKRQREVNEEELALLISDKEDRMAEMLAKVEEEKRLTRKRKADQLEAGTKKQLPAPGCPVCGWK